jgi:hypothetical protein
VFGPPAAVRVVLPMRFNVWLVVLLALMPVFVLFVGLSASSAFHGQAEWDVLGWLALAVFAASRIAIYTYRKMEG